MKETDFKKKQSMMDAVLVLIAVLLIAFIVAMIVIYCRFMSIPDTLCTCVFAACTGELGFMSLIQNSKNKYRDREWEKEDKAEEAAKHNLTGAEDPGDGIG